MGGNATAINSYLYHVKGYKRFKLGFLVLPDIIQADALKSIHIHFAAECSSCNNCLHICKCTS